MTSPTTLEDFEAIELQAEERDIFLRRFGSGPAVLLLHGFPQTHLMWRSVAPLLARRFTVICADLRGYGRSGCPASGPDHAPYDAEPLGNDPYARPPRSRQSLTDSFLQPRGYRNRSPVAAFGAADAVVPVDLDDLAAHATSDLAQLTLLIGRSLFDGADAEVDGAWLTRFETLSEKAGFVAITKLVFVRVFPHSD